MIPRPLMAALTCLALQACASGPGLTPAEEIRLRMDERFGAVGPALYPGVFGGDGQGLAMVRLYGDAEVPMSFSAQPAAEPAQTRVLDMAVDLRLVEEFPLYRIGIAPVSLSPGQAEMWSAHMIAEGVGGLRLETRLPQIRVPGPDGLIWSDWTYCAACFGLEEIDTASAAGLAPAMMHLSTAQTAARQPDGVQSPYHGELRFQDRPVAGLLFDTAAFHMASRAAQVVAAAQARAGSGWASEVTPQTFPQTVPQVFESQTPREISGTVPVPQDLIEAQRRMDEDHGSAIPMTTQPPVTDKSEIAAAPSPQAASDPATQEPPQKPVHFLARLLLDGANQELGDQGRGCVADLPCETGSIIALIAVETWCTDPQGLSETKAGSGIVVQRYFPKSRAEELQLIAGDGQSAVHVLEDEDKAAAIEGIAAARAIRVKDQPVFFTSYMDFYEHNSGVLGCTDAWRDAARVRVLQNPAALINP